MSITKHSVVATVLALYVLAAIIYQWYPRLSPTPKGNQVQSTAILTAISPSPQPELQQQSDQTHDSIRVFVGVLSRSDGFAFRQAIRQTWGSDKRLDRVMFFVLRPKSQEGFKQLRQEAVEYRDVVVTSHAEEAYLNCTYAVLDMFRTAAHIGSATHMLKTDEDCYVRVTELLNALQPLPRRWVYGGHPLIQDKYSRNVEAPRYVPFSNWPASMAPDDITPMYAWGYAAVLTMDLVRHIAAGVPHILQAPDNLLRVEDVATGVWIDYVAKEQNIKVTYATEMPFDPKECRDSLAVVHLSVQHKRVTVPDVMKRTYAQNHRCCDAL